jgi:hypothetical protein
MVASAQMFEVSLTAGSRKQSGDGPACRVPISMFLSLAKEDP